MFKQCVGVLWGLGGRGERILFPSMSEVSNDSAPPEARLGGQILKSEADSQPLLRVEAIGKSF